MSIDRPNYTQIPNIVLDEFMPEIKEAELRVLLAVCRKTFGWQKDRDRLSISQLMQLTGLSRQGVLNGIEDAMAHGIMGREEVGNSFEYFVVVNEVDQSTKLTDNSQPSRPKPVNEVDTQKKETKEIKPAALARLYEDCFGLLVTPYQMDRLIDMEKEYTTDWLSDALKESAVHNKRNLKYTEAILRRWKTEGRESKPVVKPQREVGKTYS